MKPELTPEEILNIECLYIDNGDGSFTVLHGEAIAKEQRQRIYEWGNESCTEHNREYDDFKRRNCPYCWQELRGCS